QCGRRSTTMSPPGIRSRRGNPMRDRTPRLRAETTRRRGSSANVFDVARPDRDPAASGLHDKAAPIVNVDGPAADPASVGARDLDLPAERRRDGPPACTHVVREPDPGSPIPVETDEPPKEFGQE